MSDFEFSVDDILSEFYKDLEENGPSFDEPIPDTELSQSFREEKEKAAQEEKTAEQFEPAFEEIPVKKKEPVFNPAPAEEKPKAYTWLREDDTSITHLKPQNVKTLEELYAEKPPKKVYREKKERTEPIYNGPERNESGVPKTLRVLLGFLFAILSIALLAWVGINIHPESETMTFSKANTKTNLSTRIDTYSNNSKVDVLSSVSEIKENAVIKKVYKIPEDQRVAPAPNAAAYGKVSISDASQVMDVIAEAEKSGLLDGQSVIFSPDRNFYYDSDIQYYYDETILVICWKEQVENRVTSMVEVKIADGSQIRRKLCEDTYGSSVYLYCSELAEQANAVVAMNSDYYAFRDLGITCYDRTVYRFNEYNYYGMYKAYNVTDTLFIDENGDFVIFKRGTETTKDDVQKWVNDNNLLYSIAFGPLLVENGQLVDIPDYPVGEINEEYSRAGIAQLDSLHYLYMAVSHSNDGTPRCTVRQFGEMFYNVGVKTAYCFDGGQTGEVYFHGAPYNHIDFGNERTVSDIIYFATAIGSEVVQ